MKTNLLSDMVKSTVKNVPHFFEPHLIIKHELYYKQGSMDYELASFVEYLERKNYRVLDNNKVDKYLKD